MGMCATLERLVDEDTVNSLINPFLIKNEYGLRALSIENYYNLHTESNLKGYKLNFVKSFDEFPGIKDVYFKRVYLEDFDFEFYNEDQTEEFYDTVEYILSDTPEEDESLAPRSYIKGIKIGEKVYTFEEFKKKHEVGYFVVSKEVKYLGSKSSFSSKLWDMFKENNNIDIFPATSYEKLIENVPKGDCYSVEEIKSIIKGEEDKYYIDLGY